MAVMSRKAKWLIASLAVGGVVVVGYVFRYYLLAVIFLIGPGVGIPMIVEFSSARSKRAGELVAEAKRLPPEQAVDRLGELMREYRPEPGGYGGGDTGWSVRYKALLALMEYDPVLQARVLPELIHALAHEANGAQEAKMILSGVGPHGEPAIPALIEIVKTGEPEWRRVHAGEVLGQIALAMKGEFPLRSSAVWAVGQQIVNPEFSGPYKKDLIRELGYLDPHGEHCLPYLLQAVELRSDYNRDAAVGAMIYVAQNNTDARRWLAENTEVNVDSIPDLTTDTE